MTVGMTGIGSDVAIDDGESSTGRAIEVLVSGSILRMYLFGNLNALRSSADALTTISAVIMQGIYMARTGVRWSRRRVEASVQGWSSLKTNGGAKLHHGVLLQCLIFRRLPRWIIVFEKSTRVQLLYLKVKNLQADR